jgi:hypothetical protein
VDFIAVDAQTVGEWRVSGGLTCVEGGEENYSYVCALFTGLPEEGWWMGVAFVCIYVFC